MIQEKDYICDKCNTHLYIDEVGYLGSPDDSCHPFITLSCYCRDCYDRTASTKEEDQ